MIICFICDYNEYFFHLLKTNTLEIFVIFEVMKYMFILIVDKREKELSESSEKGTGVFNLKVWRFVFHIFL